MWNRPARFACLLGASLLAATPALATEVDNDQRAPALALFAGTPSVGSGSALDAIRARQAGALPAAPRAMAVPMMGAPLFTTAAAFKPETFARETPRHQLRAAHASRPDIFGSVALGVAKTPFDSRFASVAARASVGERGAVVSGLASMSRGDAIEAANAYVNAKVDFVSDTRAHGREDRWSTAAETLRRGQGDCEDYAIAKLQLLRAAGFADDDLYFVILKDLVRRQDHAVLVVRHEGRFLVLDNGTDRILDSDAVVDYKPVFTYAAGKAWTHGYAKPSTPDVAPLFTRAVASL